MQVANLKEEIESLKAERERRNSSMKDIIHGAEGYKVRGDRGGGVDSTCMLLMCVNYTLNINNNYN